MSTSDLLGSDAADRIEELLVKHTINTNESNILPQLTLLSILKEDCLFFLIIKLFQLCLKFPVSITSLSIY